MNAQDMLKQLKLPSDNPSVDNLETLKRWCVDNASRDIKFSGSLQEQYINYAKLAAQYESFKEVVDGHVMQSMTQLNHMNSIQYAAVQGYDRYIEQLSLDPVAVNQAVTSSKMTALHLAARYGHLHTVMSLLAKGADLNLLDKNDDYPAIHSLMLSLKSRDKVTREQIFRLLNQDIPDLYVHANVALNTLFHILAQNGFTTLLDEALKINPEGVCQVNQDGEHPINLAIRNTRETQDVQRLLLSQVPSIAVIANRKGNLPLHDAACYIQDSALIQAYIDAHMGADLSLDCRNRRDETPLMLAAKAKNRPVIEALLANGADPTYKNALGKNMLDYAYQRSEDKALCDWILEKAPSLDSHQLDELMSHDIKLKF